MSFAGFNGCSCNRSVTCHMTSKRGSGEVWAICMSNILGLDLSQDWMMCWHLKKIAWNDSGKTLSLQSHDGKK